MRPVKAVCLGGLAIGAATCFFLAGQCAQALHERSLATARNANWQASLPPLQLPEQVIDVSPPTLEEAPVSLPPAPVVRKRRVAPEPKAIEAIVRNPEVEPEDAIRMALRGKRAAFEHCYETELKKQASFSGFIVIALSLAANGKVTDARVHEGNRRDAVVGACIVAALRTLQLPALTSEADLLIPIRLQAKEPS